MAEMLILIKAHLKKLQLAPAVVTDPEEVLQNVDENEAEEDEKLDWQIS